MTEGVDSPASVSGSNRPIYGVGVFGVLLLTVFGQVPSEEDASTANENPGEELPGWQTLVRFVTQWNQQFDALSEAAGVGTLTTMWTTLSSDLGLSAMTVTSRDMPLVMDVFVASLEILPGSQPLATLVRGLRSPGRLHHKSLSEQHFFQVAVIPTCGETFVLDADL